MASNPQARMPSVEDLTRPIGRGQEARTARRCRAARRARTITIGYGWPAAQRSARHALVTYKLCFLATGTTMEFRTVEFGAKGPLRAWHHVATTAIALPLIVAAAKVATSAAVVLPCRLDVLPSGRVDAPAGGRQLHENQKAEDGCHKRLHRAFTLRHALCLYFTLFYRERERGSI